MKPDNFVVINDSAYQWGFNVKLIDFGSVKRSLNQLRPQMTNSICGTIAYLPPEAFKYMLSKKSDVWSLGVIGYELIYDELPPYLEDEDTLKTFVSSDVEIELDACPGELANLKSCVRKCLSKSLTRRPLPSQLWADLVRYESDVCKQILTDTSFSSFRQLKDLWATHATQIVAARRPATSLTRAHQRVQTATAAPPQRSRSARPNYQLKKRPTQSALCQLL